MATSYGSGIMAASRIHIGAAPAGGRSWDDDRGAGPCLCRDRSHDVSACSCPAAAGRDRSTAEIGRERSTESADMHGIGGASSGADRDLRWDRLRQAIGDTWPAGGIEALCESCCVALTEVFDLIGAFAVREKPGGGLRILAHAGKQPDLLRELVQEELRWAGMDAGHRPANPLRSGRPLILSPGDPAYSLWFGSAAPYGVVRIGIWPLAVADRGTAALVLCAGDEDTLTAPASLELMARFVKRMEPAVNAQAEHDRLTLLSAALSKAACAAFVTDRDNIIEWVNEAFADLTGYAREDLIGQTPRLIKSGHQDQEYYRSVHECIRAGKAWRGELTDRRKDGSFYVAEQTITPIVENDGRRTVTHFVAIQQDISERKRMEREIRELMLHIEHARQQERCQLARELHDELGGSLASLRRDIEWLLERIDEPAHRERLLIMQELALASLGTARQVVAGLRPTLVDELGLVGALHWLIRDFVQHHDIAVHPELPVELSRLDPHRAAELYRVVQEGLTNVAKHSQANLVTVKASVGDELVLEITDNGIGASDGHYPSGGHSMTERAGLMGGYLEIEQLGDRGTRVRLRVPLKQTEHGL
ncbi:MAG: PAS domain S-box protein [Methylococcaceae bacterium]|nr:PAS domain S-box protein [Methylococcaceae bacterium]